MSIGLENDENEAGACMNNVRNEERRLSRLLVILYRTVDRASRLRQGTDHVFFCPALSLLMITDVIFFLSPEGYTPTTTKNGCGEVLGRKTKA